MQQSYNTTTMTRTMSHRQKDYKPTEILPKPTKILQHAVVLVLSLTLAMVLIAWAGIFFSATVHLGLTHYAEEPVAWLPHWLHAWIPLPFNTVVNLGYVLCGCYWINCIVSIQKTHQVQSDNMFLFFVFNSMSVVYGFMQAYRIVFQTWASAVIDQWYTLPFFMLVYIWAQFYKRHTYSSSEFYTLLLVSMSSYCLTFVTSIGFEIALACHIIFATVGAVQVYGQFGMGSGTRSFCLALLSCTGFVILKLLDHWLADCHYIFRHISGHFMSKVCDIFQIYYVNQFFYDLMVCNAAGSKKKLAMHPNLSKHELKKQNLASG